MDHILRSGFAALVVSNLDMASYAYPSRGTVIALGEKAAEVLPSLQELRPEATYIVSDPYPINSRDASADLVYGIDLSQTVPTYRLEDVGSEISRVLRPGGIFLAMESCTETQQELLGHFSRQGYEAKQALYKKPDSVQIPVQGESLRRRDVLHAPTY